MAKVVLFGVAAVALVMAAVFGKIGFDTRRDAGRFAALERLRAADFAAPGRLGVGGYLEGRLAADNPVLAHGLAFYYRSKLVSMRTTDSGKEPSWRALDRQLPPLILETGDDGVEHGVERGAAGRVGLFGDYAVTFRGSDPSPLSTERLEVGVTERFEGLPPGHPVVAVGTVARGPGGLGLDTERLASGTWADLVAGERSGATFASIAAAVLLGAAAVCLIVAIGV